MTELVREIQHHLDRLGWSQRDLATRAGIGSATVSKLMRGVHTPSPSTIQVIARALGVEPSHLLRLAGFPMPTGQYDPEAAYIARKITELPNGVRKRAIDILGTQLDSIYEMTGQIPPSQTREEEMEQRPAHADMPPELEAALKDVVERKEMKDDLFLALKVIYQNDPVMFAEIMDSVLRDDDEED